MADETTTGPTTPAAGAGPTDDLTAYVDPHRPAYKAAAPPPPARTDGGGEERPTDEAVIAAATPGPWFAVDGDQEGFPGEWDVHDAKGNGVCSMADWPTKEANAEFVARARTGWPAAVAEAARLRGEVAALRERYDVQAEHARRVVGERDALRAENDRLRATIMTDATCWEHEAGLAEMYGRASDFAKYSKWAAESRAALSAPAAPGGTADAGEGK